MMLEVGVLDLFFAHLTLLFTLFKLCVSVYLLIYIIYEIIKPCLKESWRLIINSLITRRQFLATVQQMTKENKYCTHMNTLIVSGWIFLSFFCILYPVVLCDCSRDINGETEMTTQSENARTDYDVKVFYKMMAKKIKTHPTPPVGILFY